MPLLLAAALGGARAEGAADDSESLDYAILARNAHDGALEFLTLDRFPDMMFDPRLQAPGIESSERAVIRDAKAWRGFWARAHPELEPRAAELDLDFDRHMALVSAAGAKPGPTAQTIVVDVLETPHEILVRVEETDRSCAAVGAPGSSHPLSIVRVRRSAKPVRFAVEPLPCAPDASSRDVE